MKTLIGPKSGRKYVMQSGAVLVTAAASGRHMGYCIRCGYECDGIEPDASGYACEDCGANGVYGAEQLLFMGLFHE
jgi:anaerobic ribonucleoside-triphosphate reductase